MNRFQLAAGIFLWVPFQGTAQSPAVTATTQTGGGLTSVVFQTPMGVIRANFPGDAAAGDTLSGTVTDEPSGATLEEKNTNGATLSGYVVDTQNRQTTPKERRALWFIPASTTALTVLLRDPSGQPVARATLPVAPPAVPDLSSQPITPGDFDLPTWGQEGRTVPINGRFTGEVRTTTVSVAGRPAEVLAESSRRAVFQVPDGLSGSAPIELHERSVTVTSPFRVLTVQLAGDTNLTRGQTAPLTISVGGLAGSTEPAEMTLENRSPGVVVVSGGQVQNFAIPPQAVSPAGTYITMRTMTGIMHGRFDISAFVRQQPLERFDPRQPVARALDQWQTRTGIPITSGAQMLIARSVRASRNELNRLLQAQAAASDPQAILANLVRSYCFQLRDYKSGVLTASVPPSFPAGFRSPFVLAFQAASRAAQPIAESDGNQHPAASAAQPITESDVNQHPFLAFLKNLMDSLSGNMQLSELDVCSVPDAALILIDGKRVGATTASFMVSMGQHKVVVNVPGKACTVTAKAGQDLFVACPRSTRCSPPK